MPVSILFAAAALAALLFWIRHAGHDAPSIAASGLKTASVALLALAGLVAGAPGWIVLGLGLGALGDLALSLRGERAFLAGMLGFALGHLAYAAGFVGLMGPGAPALSPGFWIVGALMLALVALTMVWIAPRAGGLGWPVRAYALVIALMALCAALLPPGWGSMIVKCGTAGFVASDLILAIRLFVLRDPGAQLLASRVLWPLYWGGQALILLGVT
ncbi:MAG: lysoplasmalogenase [Rhodobacteraceae bacterium]|jgi:uncharacterized membrane protein YhhN|nr:lysoplasmalogenase [Paracoccaceae bacterium]